MAWTLQQHKDSTPLATEPIALAFPGNVTNGNLIVVFYQWGAGSGSFTPSKSAGTATIGAFTVAKVVNDVAANQSIGISWCLVTATGSLTVSCTSGTGAGSSESHISEWSGNTATPNDVFGGQLNASSPITTGNITTTANGDLVIGAAADDSGASTLSHGTGFTLIDGPTNANEMCSEYQIQGSSGNIAATWATTGAENTLTVVGSFKVSGGVTRALFLNDLMTGDGVGGSFFRNPLA